MTPSECFSDDYNVTEPLWTRSFTTETMQTWGTFSMTKLNANVVCTPFGELLYKTDESVQCHNVALAVSWHSTYGTEASLPSCPRVTCESGYDMSICGLAGVQKGTAHRTLSSISQNRLVRAICPTPVSLSVALPPQNV